MIGVGVSPIMNTSRQAPLLLDLLTDAVRGLSTRRVKRSWGGAAIRVRRSSDDTETDIGFVGDELDVVALEAFAGAGNAFVTKWYDQSGNGRHAIMATAAIQPQIVASGSVLTKNGKPALKFTTAPTYLTTAYTFSQPYTYAVVACRDADIGGAYESLVGGLDWSNSLGTQATTGFISIYAGATLISSTVFPQIPTSLIAVYNGLSSAIYKDGSSIASGSAGFQGSTTGFTFNGWGESAGSETGSYSMSEFVQLNKVPSSTERSTINSSQSFFLT